jgi:hypothetical protein
VAGYQWGSYILETTALFQADGQMITRAIAGAAAGTLPFESAMQMRTTLAVLHELVHLAQDVGTGIGAHDQVITRDPTSRIIDQGRWLITRHDDPPYRAVGERMLAQYTQRPWVIQLRSDLAILRDATVGLRQLRGKPWLMPGTRRVLDEMLGVQVPDEDLRLYSLRALLECQAASNVYRTVATSRVSDAGAMLLQQDEMKLLWMPELMGEEYYGPLLDIAQAFDRNIDEEGLAKGFLGYVLVLNWAVDLVCAYPPEGLACQLQIDGDLFNPVVRFILMLRAFTQMTDHHFQAIADALIQHEMSIAEEILANYMPVAYPTTQSVYEAWLQELQPLAASDEWDAPLFRMRMAMIKARLDGLPTGLPQAAMSEVPIQTLVQNAGIRGILWGQDLIQEDMREALLLRNVDRELLNLIYEDEGRYRCPFGRAHVCPGRLPHCLSGLTRIDQFPSEDACEVRRYLHKLGYAI